jgi:hypothetical protein
MTALNPGHGCCDKWPACSHSWREWYEADRKADEETP